MDDRPGHRGASTTDDGDSPVEIIIRKKYEESMCKTYLPLLVVRRCRQSATGLRLLRPSYGLATSKRPAERQHANLAIHPSVD